MKNFDYFDFHIENYTPETLPFNRLLEYLTQLKKLFKDCDVHFIEVKKGSAAPAFQVNRDDSDKIESIISTFDQSEYYDGMFELLRKDQTNAYFTKNNKVIFRFTGVNDNIKQEEKEVKEFSTLEGTIIKIGGKDETIPVTITDLDNPEKTYKCNTSKDIAIELAKHLFASIQVEGNASWLRKENKTWELKKFDIKNFCVLDDTPAVSVIKNNLILDEDWCKTNDLRSYAKKIREDTE